MIKKFNFIYLALIITTGILLSNCQTSSQKVDKAEENVADAKQELKEVVKDAQTEAIKVADNVEWTVFRDQTTLKINNNQSEISELKTKMKSTGKTMDAVYVKKIEDLEQKNKDLKVRMDNYEKNQSDWESFKREFNHDMDALGAALKDIVVNNKK